MIKSMKITKERVVLIIFILFIVFSGFFIVSQISESSLQRQTSNAVNEQSPQDNNAQVSVTILPRPEEGENNG